MDKEDTNNNGLMDLGFEIIGNAFNTVGSEKLNPIFDPIRMKQIVFDLLYEKIKDVQPAFSEVNFNQFICCYNSIFDYLAERKIEEVSEITGEEDAFKEKIDLLQLTSLDGETIFEDKNGNIETHIIYDEIATIIFFYLCYTVSEKQIKIADLGRYLPDNRGLDTNFEFANGLIVREIMSFWENNKQFKKWHTIKSYLPFISKLEAFIFDNKYREVSYIEENLPPANLDGVIVNVPYVSIPYQYGGEVDMHLEDKGRIDFTRLERFLEEALKPLSPNGAIFLVFRMLDVDCELDSDYIHGIHYLEDGKPQPNFRMECPSLMEWPELYNLFSKFGLDVESIIQTDDQPNDDAPGFVRADYYDSSGVIILRNKNTVNKPFYSVINLIQSRAGKTVAVLQKLLKEIVHGTKITDKDLIVEYINKNVDFNGYIVDTKNKEVYFRKQKSQISQGFRELTGKDLAKKINCFDINLNTGFEEAENSIFIPLSGDLLFETLITFSIDEFDELLGRCAIRYKQLRWEHIPWYSFVLKILNDPDTSADEKEQLNDVLKEFNDTVWEKNKLFDITQFGYEIIDNVIYYKNYAVQEVSKEENEEERYETENLNWMLARQVLQSNVFEVVLNPKVILPAYLKLLFNTRAGEIYRRELSYNDIELSRVNVFLKTKLVVPSIELQNKYLQHADYIENQKQQLESLKKKFYEYIGGGDIDSGLFDNAFKLVEKYDYGTPDMMRFVIGSIPQPIASILYLDECEDSIARKNINYYHLFEAISHFHAVVSLSMIKNQSNCIDIFDNIMNEIFLKDISSKKKEIRADFGLWTALLLRIEEKCTENLPFDKQVNKELRIHLNKARLLRNKQMGHAPRWSDLKEKELTADLKNLAKDIIKCFSQLYSGYELISGPFRREEADTENNTSYVYCYKAIGPNPRFSKEKLEIKGYTRLLNHRLYLAEQGTWNTPIELLPLINYMPLCEDDDKLNSLGYFHSANLVFDGVHDNRSVIWCSYDCGDNNTSKQKYSDDPVTRDLINFLRPYWEKKIK